MKQLINVKNILLYSLALVLLVACEPEPLDIDVPQTTPKLVVYSQALPDQALIVTLSKSFSALSAPNEPEDTTQQDSINNVFLNQFLVDSAIVTINGADYNDTLIRLAKGVYAAPFFPYTPGNSYQLSAYDPATNFFVTSVTTTLPIVGFDSISANRQTGRDSMYLTLDYKIDDPIDAENYYLINVYGDSIPESNFFSFTDDANANSVAFSDREYPKGKLQREDEFELFSGDSIVVTVTNISKAYFEYIEARDRSGNSFLSEPISFPTNVNNGFGYFNIHFPSTQIVRVR